eukprot:m.379644 g.379644  ORF g.379644 m.379644 type:complete len:82 (-) comp99360_c0_seq1:36-281(-)
MQPPEHALNAQTYNTYTPSRHTSHVMQHTCHARRTHAAPPLFSFTFSLFMYLWTCHASPCPLFHIFMSMNLNDFLFLLFIE